MKRKRVQVTCVCSAYKFPHRIDGGRCTGDAWAASYFELVGECCKRCVANRGADECDVACGAESIMACEGFRDHLLYQSTMRLPVKLEALMERKLSYYEERLPPRRA
ncbi:MAG: hypothetical protein WBL19_01130 [Minisyncoccia bacterium]